MALKRKTSVASNLKNPPETPDGSSQSRTKPRAKRARPSTQSTPVNPESSKPHPSEKQKRIPPETLSILTPAEIDFPRGGGTQLTGVELTQARHEGKKDAEDLFTSSSLSISQSTVAGTSSSKRKRQGQDPRAKKPLDGHTSCTSISGAHVSGTIRIEHLNVRRLTPGIKIAGLIIEIRPLELIVSLPSQLVGHVPITEISSYYTKQLEDSADQEENGDSDDAESDSKNGFDEFSNHSTKLQGLNEIFKVGRVNVTSGPPAQSSDRVSPLVRAARRVTLSLDPARLNSDLTKAELVSNMTLDGAVKSIEDNGYVLDLGVPVTRALQASSLAVAAPTMTAFVRFSDATQQPPLNGQHWQVGQIIQCQIKKVSDTGSTCTVLVDPVGYASSILSLAANINCVLPLHLVSCLITAVIPGQGLNVQFLGYFKGTIDLSSVSLNGDDNQLSQRFQAGQKIRARVLWNTLSSNHGFAGGGDQIVLAEKVFSLSLLEHYVKLDPYGLPRNLLSGTPDSTQESIEHLMRYSIGYVFQSVQIYRVEDEWGLFVVCMNGENGDSILDDSEGSSVDKRVFGFVHISAISDSPLPSISPKSGPYAIKTTHKARVTGISPVDGMLQLSLKPSLVERIYMRPQDLPAGEVVSAEISKLGASGLFLSIFGGLDCVVWPEHYADVAIRHPEKKFQVGAKVTARTLYVDPDKHRIVLTLKKSLVKTDLPLITSYATAQVGMVTLATISKVQDKFLLVYFFGGTRGLILKFEACENSTESLSQFMAGQVVKVRITSVDAVQRKILASIKQALLPPDSNLWNSCAVGDTVVATVSVVQRDHVIFTIRQQRSENKLGPEISIPGLMSLKTIASQRKMTLDQLRDQIKKGDELRNLIIAAKDTQKPLVILGYKKPGIGALVLHSEAKLTAEIGVRVVGTITHIGESVISLQLQKSPEEGPDKGSLEGLISVAFLAKHRDIDPKDIKQHFALGDKISDLIVTKLDNEREVVIVGFPSEKKRAPASNVRVPLSSSAFEIGDLVVGTVLDVHEKNVLFFLKKDKSRDDFVGQGLLSIEKLAERRHVTPEELRSQLAKGDQVDDLIVKHKATKRRDLSILGFRPSVAPVPRQTSEGKINFQANMSVVGIVRAIHEKNVVLLLHSADSNVKDCASVFGLISKKVLAGHWNTTVEGLKTKLSEGDEISRLVIKKVNLDKGLIIVGFEQQESQPTRYFPNAASPSAENLKIPDFLADETIYQMVVVEKVSEGVRVQPVEKTYPGWSFLINYTDVDDDYDHPMDLVKGEQKACALVKVDRKARKVYLTSRPSRCKLVERGSSNADVRDKPVFSIKDLKKGDRVRGFVSRISEKTGLIVSIGTNLQAKVRISELFDKDIPDWTTKFKVGQVVSGVIITIVKCTRGIQLSLRENPEAPKGKLSFAALQKGQVFGTSIRKIERYGLFLQIGDSKISGLCHTSEIFEEKMSEELKSTWADKFSEGMKLKAAILAVDLENRKVSFSIKPSRVGVQEDSKKDSSSEAESENEDADEADHEYVASPPKDQLLPSAMDMDTDEGDIAIESPSHPAKSSTQPNSLQSAVNIQAPCLDLRGGFNWNAPAESGRDSESGESNDENSASSDGTAYRGKHVKSLPKSNASGPESGLPSPAEIERLLLGSPNSSLLWIQLMSHHLQRGDINEARETAKRALNGIHYREEAEKLNVWIAWLNLENSYGLGEQMDRVFADASAANDKKTLWLKTAEIYTGSGKTDRADELYAKLVKKFSESSKVWSLYGRFCLLNGRTSQAADLLARSLKSLPKRKHIKTITKFAQYDFKHGDPERGRTLFEGLLANYPKRTDLWNIYIDLEVKDGPRLERIRAIFARMLALQLNPKRSKFAFKKWLGIEKKYGDEASQSNVLEQARAYVQASTVPTTNVNEEEQDND